MFLWFILLLVVCLCVCLCVGVRIWLQVATDKCFKYPGLRCGSCNWIHVLYIRSECSYLLTYLPSLRIHFLSIFKMSCRKERFAKFHFVNVRTESYSVAKSEIIIAHYVIHTDWHLSLLKNSKDINFLTSEMMTYVCV